MTAILTSANATKCDAAVSNISLILPSRLSGATKCLKMRGRPFCFLCGGLIKPVCNGWLLIALD